MKDFIVGNGIDYCNLKKKFYFSISDLGSIVSFKLEKNKLKKKKIFCKIPKKYGIPDGITVDRTGPSWVSCWNGSCVLRLDQTGKIILSIKVPSKFPTSLCFGGVNFNEIIVMNEKNGKPFIKLRGKTMEIIKKKFKKKPMIALSLSDEKKYAVAFVTISL